MFVPLRYSLYASRSLSFCVISDASRAVLLLGYSSVTGVEIKLPEAVPDCVKDDTALGNPFTVPAVTVSVKSFAGDVPFNIVPRIINVSPVVYPVPAYVVEAKYDPGEDTVADENEAL